jgi:hypothetical protein
VFVPEAVAKEKTSAQRSLMGKTWFPQQLFGTLIHIIDHRWLSYSHQ